MNETICRLCLQTIISDNSRAIEESLVKTLKLNLKISQEPVMCIDCARCLQVFSKLTPGHVYEGDGTSFSSDLRNDARLDPVKVEEKCNFCTETHGREDLILLNESKENKFLVNALEQYNSEMNLTKELLTCGACLEALQGVFGFISKRLEVEKKIREYIELEGTDDRGQVELKEVQQFMFRPILKLDVESVDIIKLEEQCGRIKDEDTTSVKGEKEISQPELIVKTEGADIKLEQSDCDGFQDNLIGNKIPSDPLRELVVIPDTRKCKKKIFYCEIHSYKTKHGGLWKRHLSSHKSVSEVKAFKCKLCPYETKRKSHLKLHLIIHKSPSELEMFKCDLCSYEAKQRSNLKNHLLIHKSPSELRMFNCGLCSYATKRKCDLQKHLLTHKSASETELFKCEFCSYEAIQKSHLNNHLLVHKRPSDLKKFKCDFCSFATRRKDGLDGHLVTHKSPLELRMFKCELCSFETKYKRNFQRHSSTHSKLNLFKCDRRSYKAKQKSETKMFKCASCPYETIQKSNLTAHLLIHKSPSEIKMFKCDFCSFETKRKDTLKQHLLIHKCPSELKMFKCELCSFETKHKRNFDRHLLTHKSRLETKMFKCASCPYEAKRKYNFDRHLLTHRK